MNDTTTVDQLLSCSHDIYILLKTNPKKVTPEMIQKFNLLVGESYCIRLMTIEQKREFYQYWNSIKKILGKKINVKLEKSGSEQLLECARNIARKIQKDPKMLKVSEIWNLDSLIMDADNLDGMTIAQRKKFSQYWSIIQQDKQKTKIKKRI